jgi:hypothetical protein
VAYLARDRGELREGEDHGSGEPIGETFGQGLGMTPRSHCQREEEERKIPARGGERKLGRGRFRGWAELLPGALLYFFLSFFFFFFCFLISFISFSNLV